jgi:hypothetical protein
MSFLDATDDYVSWRDQWFTAELTARLPVSGLWVYTWREVIPNPTGPGYVKLDAGRAGSPDDCPAYELHNTSVPVTDPAHIDDPARVAALVWMRLRGVCDNGKLVYEFRNPRSRYGTWAQLTAYSVPYYSWTEVYWNGAGWAVRVNGYSGTLNAHEYNGQRCRTDADPPANIGETVWMELSDGPDGSGAPWVFRGTGLDSFPAQISGPPATLPLPWVGTGHPWVEWDTRTNVPLSGGRSSTTEGAYARDLTLTNEDLTGHLVELSLDRTGLWYNFLAHPRVRLASGGNYADVRVLDFDQSRGFTLAHNSVGSFFAEEVGISLDPAIVVFTSGDQTISGVKTFTSVIVAVLGVNVGSSAHDNRLSIGNGGTRQAIGLYVDGSADGSTDARLQLLSDGAGDITCRLQRTDASGGNPKFEIADTGSTWTGGTATTGGAVFKGGLYISGAITGSGGTVTGITAGSGLSGGTITGSGTIAVLTGLSITIGGSGIQLVGDSASPGASKYYGTDAGSVKGWYSLPSPGTGTVTSVATTNSISGGTITTTGTLQLVNDSGSPGNSKYYGTDSGGTKGFFSLPSGGAGTSAPSNFNSPGTAGQIAVDGSGNFYVCYGTNAWAKFVPDSTSF